MVDVLTVSSDNSLNGLKFLDVATDVILVLQYDLVFFWGWDQNTRLGQYWGVQGIFHRSDQYKARVSYNEQFFRQHWLVLLQ
eukprot:6152824-Ditylum_brightwellii.AAC.1